MFNSVNPYTGQTIANYGAHSEHEVERRIQSSAEAFRSWRKTSLQERANALLRTADILTREKGRFARLMTEEMGKTYASAEAEAAKCAWVCRYYAVEGESALATMEVETDATESYVVYQPLGPVLAIMPWNFPFWQVFRFAAPALLAGNTALLKHAENVCGCALAIEDVFSQAGLPAGVFQTLLIEVDRVETLLADDRIAAATLTGSERAGRAVASQAGRAIKKTVLELGGSDPFIVCASARLPGAVQAGVKSRTINGGQSCIAAKRFIVMADVYEEFRREFAAAMQALKVGDPMAAETDLGPLAAPRFLEAIESQVERAVAAGAKVLTGGRRIEGQPNCYEPTVLVDVPRNRRANTAIYREEFFGPVAMLFRVESVDEAIEVANDTQFGLGASVWTEDDKERARFIAGIDAGAIFFNAMVASDPRLPFGGVKRSGYGRELGELGIREFTNAKTIYRK